jgi:RNA polymerase sigma factor (sigma-70 family)
MGTDRLLALDGFGILLERLDQDDLRAAWKYRNLVGILLVYCEQQMQHPAYADDIVRRAIDIVATKLAGGEDILNLQAYSFSVARHLLCDYRKRLMPEYIDDSLTRTLKCNRHLVQIDSIEKEVREECREKCLQNLPGEQRDLIVKYYERGLYCKSYREEMARDLGISVEALNNRISRIKKKLSQCCHGCASRLNAERLPAIAICA